MSHDDLYTAVEAILGALGCPLEDRLRCADTLLYADLRGIDSHGVSNLMPSYLERLKNGFVNPAPKLWMLREAKATATVDNHRGLDLTMSP